MKSAEADGGFDFIENLFSISSGLPDFIFCLAKDFIPFAPIGKNSHPLENWAKIGVLSAVFGMYYRRLKFNIIEYIALLSRGAYFC